MGRKKKIVISFTIKVDKAKEARRRAYKNVSPPAGRFHSSKKGKKGYDRKKGKAIPRD